MLLIITAHIESSILNSLQSLQNLKKDCAKKVSMLRSQSRE